MSSPIAMRGGSPLRKDFVVRIRRKIRVGPMVVDIRSNEEHFVGMRYFPPGDQSEDHVRADYILSFCNLSVDAPWPLQTLWEEQDKSYRAKKFAAGYYITDHFGSPAYLITRGTHYWIFGTDFEPILWPYVVKLLLTLYSMERQVLHLKAASVAIGPAGTLLVGRGGGGKTVLLTQLCRRGAQFLSNTHALIDNHTTLAVPTAMRVRNDVLFAPMIATRRLPEGLKHGEYLADPCEDLGWRGGLAAHVNNICLVDYRGTTSDSPREIDRDILFDYMEQFSLPVNVYGLKEDILDHLAGDVTEFSAQMSRMKAKLRTLVDQCRGYHVSCDAMNPRTLECLYEMLGASAPSPRLLDT
jgi:hypothetical protein